MPEPTRKAFTSELVDRLAATPGPVLSVLPSRTAGTLVQFTGRALVEASTGLASRLIPAGSGRTVLLLLPHSTELFLLQVGLVLAGHVPGVLAWPTSRVDSGKYHRNLVHQLAGLPADELVTTTELAAALQRVLPYRVTGCRIEGVPPGPVPSLDGVEPAPPARSDAGSPPADSLFLQFSGGTTGAQKCVVVGASMLARQLETIARALAVTTEDAVVSWLPLYHDMGLIACLWLPLCAGARSIQLSASDWLLEPDLLFRLGEAQRATLCWLPNFAFAYLALQRDRYRAQVDLGCMRAWINCSEPVRARAMQQFATTFESWGVRPEQLQASYAMAENVFAVTQTPLGRPVKRIARSMVRGRGWHAGPLGFEVLDETFLSSGRVLDGTEVRIRDESGRRLGPYVPGAIEIRGASLFAGYWGRGGFRTQAFTDDGWYVTGDYGLVDDDDEVYVVGRIQDLIIVGGHNVVPEDVEVIVNSVEGVYAGRAVALGVDDRETGTQQLVLVAERRHDAARDAAQLEREIKVAVLAALGLAPRRVFVVPERWIVKSTAGKISRSDTRERVAQEFGLG